MASQDTLHFMASQDTLHFAYWLEYLAMVYEVCFKSTYFSWFNMWPKTLKVVIRLPNIVQVGNVDKVLYDDFFFSPVWNDYIIEPNRAPMILFEKTKTKTKQNNKTKHNKQKQKKTKVKKNVCHL